jgi:hypothetical protein
MITDRHDPHFFSGMKTNSYHYSPIKLAVAAAILVIAVFADVVFLGASFRPSDVGSSHTVNSSRAVEFGAQRPGRQLYHGYNDVGTSVWGLEPGQIFLRRSIKHKESPYWNPYSSGGEVGVESMTDSKYSLFSLLVSLIGTHSIFFNVAYLLLLITSVFFLIKICVEFLNLSFIPATIGAAVFVMNGFHTSNLTNILVQPYLCYPPLLYSLLSLQRGWSFLRFFGAVVAHVILIATVFPPTIIFVLGACYLIAFTLCERESIKQKVLSLASAAYAGLTAILLLSPLLVPLVISWSYVDTFTQYATRANGKANFIALVSTFSPKHFWESYNSFELYRDKFKSVGWLEASWIHHMGIIPYTLAAVAVSQLKQKSLKHKGLLIALVSLVLLSVGRAMNFAPFSLIDYVPVIRSIQPGYFGGLLAISMSLLTALGAQVFLEFSNKRSVIGTSLGFGVLLLVLLITAGLKINFEMDGMTKWYLVVFALSCVSLPTLALLSINLTRSRPHVGKRVIAISVLALVTSELWFYLNTYRPQRPTFSPIDARLVPYGEILRGSQKRTLSIGRETLPPEWGVAYGIRQADGFRESVLPWYKSYFIKTFGRPVQDLSFEVADPFNPRIPLASYLGVHHFIVSKQAPESLRLLQSLGLTVVNENSKSLIFQNSQAFDRARLYAKLTRGEVPVDATAQTMESVLFSNDPDFIKQVEGSSLLTSNWNGDLAVAKNAEIVNETNTMVVVKTESDIPALLSLAEAWHPNWTATIDGQPTVVGRVNDAFRGVVVPAGEHTVIFSYRVPGYGLIQILFGLGIVMLFAPVGVRLIGVRKWA